MTRSVASQQDGEPSRRGRAEEKQGVGRTGRKRVRAAKATGPHAPLSVILPLSFFWCVCFWLSTEYRAMSSPLSHSLFGFLVWYMGNFNREGGGGGGRTGKGFPPAMGLCGMGGNGKKASRGVAL
jgi:hypothetical protein